jgi:hypothetical protein
MEPQEFHRLFHSIPHLDTFPSQRIQLNPYALFLRNLRTKFFRYFLSVPLASHTLSLFVLIDLVTFYDH